MRGGIEATICLMILVSLFAGCLGGDGIGSGEGDPADDANPWQKGLDPYHETPEGVHTRSDETRRADAYPPGSLEFTDFDAATQAFMTAFEVPSGQIALFHNGALLYEQAYGVADPDGTQARLDTLFRMASVTKPMTAALIQLQVDQGLYNLNDPVFCIGPDPSPDCRLPIDPHPDHPIIDERIADVQVGHLIEHTGGWGRTTDWVYRAPGTHEIAATLGVDSPGEPWRLAQYLMGEELADDPGTSFWYCNSCYMLLGLVAEAATGADLQALYDAYLFRPLDVEGEIELGRTLLADRNPRETHYRCDGEATSVYDEDKTVCAPDGGYAMEIISSAGGLIGTATAVASVYEAYPEFTRPNGFSVQGNNVYDPIYEWNGHGGLLNGVIARAGIVTDHPSLAGEVQYVIMFSSSRPFFCPSIEHPAIGTYVFGCAMDYFEQLIMNLSVGRSVTQSL